MSCLIKAAAFTTVPSFGSFRWNLLRFRVDYFYRRRSRNYREDFGYIIFIEIDDGRGEAEGRPEAARRRVSRMRVHLGPRVRSLSLILRRVAALGAKSNNERQVAAAECRRILLQSISLVVGLRCRTAGREVRSALIQTVKRSSIRLSRRKNYRNSTPSALLSRAMGSGARRRDG